MDIPDYKPNSHKYRAEQEQKKQEEKKRVDKVIKGSARIRTNNVRRLTDAFISEDAKNVKSHVFMEVLVPSIKKAVVDIVTDGVHMIFFGGTRRGRSGSNASKVSYSSYYDRRDDRPSTQQNYTRRFTYDDIVIDSRDEAENVLARMYETIDTYGQVTIGDLYDMVEITGSYTDNKYGWTNLRGARVEPVRDGWILVLPKAKPLTI